MGYAEVTKQRNLRLVEINNTDVTTDANIPDAWTLHRRFYHLSRYK
jgi:hypothetical protein